MAVFIYRLAARCTEGHWHPLLNTAQDDRDPKATSAASSQLIRLRFMAFDMVKHQISKYAHTRAHDICEQIPNFGRAMGEYRELDKLRQHSKEEGHEDHL